MIIKQSDKPIKVIGFENSTITQEGVYFLSAEFDGEITIISPDDFISLPNKNDYQYLVFFTLDVEKRKQIINLVEELELECVSFVHDTVVIYKDLKKLQANEIAQVIGHGSVICPFSSIFLNAQIGKHCLIESYCLVSHYCVLEDNVILHSGVMIAGKTKIGANSVFNFKATALNGLTICNDVEVGALSAVTKSIDRSGRYVGSVARYVGERALFNTNYTESNLHKEP
jgi:UDP-3-O-[3-hydroxymyristoyl] glucosamine N-acyltransferase